MAEHNPAEPTPPNATAVGKLELPLERDVFLRSLVRELAGTLHEAAGFVSVVGQRIGDQINQSYTAALAVERLTRPQVAAVLVDLKRRIRGDLYVIVESDENV